MHTCWMLFEDLAKGLTKTRAPGVQRRLRRAKGLASAASVGGRGRGESSPCRWAPHLRMRVALVSRRSTNVVESGCRAWQPSSKVSWRRMVDVAEQGRRSSVVASAWQLWPWTPARGRPRRRTRLRRIAGSWLGADQLGFTATMMTGGMA
jgi:hypothetical protein